MCKYYTGTCTKSREMKGDKKMKKLAIGLFALAVMFIAAGTANA